MEKYSCIRVSFAAAAFWFWALFFDFGVEIVLCSENETRALDPRIFPVYALYFAKFTFSITPRKASWREAVEICKERNGRLAEFGSEAEFNTVLSFIKSSGVKSSKTFWTGIHFLRQKDYWGIHTGGAARYLRWSPSEPKLFDGDEKRECVMLWNPSQDRRGDDEWNFSLSTEVCTQEMFSICRTNC